MHGNVLMLCIDCSRIAFYNFRNRHIDCRSCYAVAAPARLCDKHGLTIGAILDPLQHRPRANFRLDGRIYIYKPNLESKRIRLYAVRFDAAT